MRLHLFYIALAFLLLVSSECHGQVSVKDFLQYRNIGPTRGGRVTTVAGVTSKPSVFYMGATGGGVWKTDDYGTSWSNVSDGYFDTPSIGAIRVSESNPEVIYVGTGSDGLRSNVITGKGVYKSDDAADTWTHIGLKETGHIGAVEIHPENPDIVYVAAIGQAFEPNEERGIFKTTDGGESWNKILYINDTVGFSDLEIHPTNPDIVYAGAWRAERKPWTIISGGEIGGIYRSVDAGKNWTKLDQGLPTGLIGKTDLAVSAAEPDRLYALIEAPQGIGGLYKSEMKGDSFDLISTKKELLDRPFYYCNVDADPNNADIVYVNSTRYFKSEDTGKTWKKISTPHGDNHDLWINPNNSDLQIQGNDGGANVTFNGGKTWSTQLNQSTAELYQVEVDHQYPYWLYAGQQDNSTTISVPSAPPFGVQGGGIAYVRNTGGCETGPAVPKPNNPNIVYSNCKGRFGVYNKATGQEQRYYVGASNMYGHNPKDLEYRFQRVSPIHVSPHDPDVIYHCSQFVHKSINDGKTWETISPDLTAFTPETQTISGSPITRDITGEEFYSTIYSIRESPVGKGVIWVGANDGPVHVTTDGGGHWTNVSPPTLKSGGRVDSVEPSPHQAGKAIISSLRYQLGDWTPYIFITRDYGKTWKSITNGIPNDYPVRVVREDPNQEGLLYAGTEFGMFISFDDGENWESFQQNLPVTPITDIKLHRYDLVISTMGRGFWILDNLSPLYQEAELNKKVVLFQPKNNVRMRYRGTSKKTIPYYPTAGINIDYYLPKDIDNQLRLDILNGDQTIIRSYFSEIPVEEDETKERDMATGFIKEGISAALKTEKGAHRFTWDMRHAGPWDKKASKAFKSGPLAIPGEYTVRLTIDKKQHEQSFKLKPDPRAIQSGIKLDDMLAQQNLALKTVSLMNKAKRKLASLEGELKNLESSDKKSQEDIDNVKSQINSFKTQEGRYQLPTLVSQISYLFSMLKQADQKPGQDAYDRFEELEVLFNKLNAD